MVRFGQERERDCLQAVSMVLLVGMVEQAASMMILGKSMAGQGRAGSGCPMLCFHAASMVVQKKLKQPTNIAL